MKKKILSFALVFLMISSLFTGVTFAKEDEAFSKVDVVFLIDNT